jgi:hypothetical protein
MNQQDIDAELSAMEARFREGANSHFEITVSESRTFEKGSYHMLLARPKRRMSQMLGVSREIMTLVTNFPEQQARVIAAARAWIASAPKGRLEPQHAIVVHSDRRGNTKLRTWGLEQGISIIPIFTDDCPKNGEEFERLLASEIFQWDPFEVTGPVADDSQFYGRKAEATQMAQRLQTGQILSLLGVRKVGKTSVLNRVIAGCKERHDCDIVMLDCSQDAVWASSAPRLLLAIRQAIAACRDADHYAVVTSVPATAGDIASEASALTAQVLKADRPLLLFVDEVDYITPGSPTSPSWRVEFNPFWRNIRAVYQEASRQKARFSLVVSGVSSKWFSLERIEGIENAALSFVPEAYLGPLAVTACAAMVSELGKRCGLRIDREAAEHISRTCGCMPFWVRRACSAIHRVVELDRRPVPITRAQADTYLEDFLVSEGSELARVALSHLFSVYPELQTACEAAAAAPIPATTTRDRHQRSLERYGLVALEVGQYTMPAIFRHGLRAYLADKLAEESERAQDPTRGPGGLDAVALGDWAEDLAVIGKRRNAVERKLRRVLVGLIRADVLAKKGGANVVADRIRNSIATERHKGLPTDPDQLADKMFWLELLTLADKEWALVSALFGDKDELKRNGLIVNERPDAHAKQCDAADLALWRRSLQWFEDRLAKL